MTREFTIDPEDRSQVERLTRSLVDVGAIASTRVVLRAVDEVQAALRSLVTPPETEEPTGLGAVVEAADGATWVRVDLSAKNCWVRAGFGIRSSWPPVRAVRILSPGVTA